MKAFIQGFLLELNMTGNHLVTYANDAIRQDDAPHHRIWSDLKSFAARLKTFLTIEARQGRKHEALGEFHKWLNSLVRTIEAEMTLPQEPLVHQFDHNAAFDLLEWYTAALVIVKSLAVISADIPEFDTKHLSIELCTELERLNSGVSVGKLMDTIQTLRNGFVNTLKLTPACI